MEFKDIETVKKEIKEGEDFLKRISPIHPIEIKRILEDIYELFMSYIEIISQSFYRISMNLLEYLILSMISMIILFQQV